MTLPAAYAVARACPNDRFTFLTRSPFDQLFVNAPANLHVITDESWRDMKFTHVADLHNVLRSWRIDLRMLLRGCRVRMMDKRRWERRAILKGKKTSQPFTERYERVFQQLGFAMEKPVPIALEQHLKQGIGIAPFARYATKTYTIKQMHQVVRLLGEQGKQVYLFGARGAEARLLERWAEEMPHCTNLAGTLTLGEELQRMAQLECMVAMDSANGHMAALVGTRVVTLWGSTTPACGFLPFGQAASDQLLLQLPCQPCSIAGCKTCKLHTHACLRQLTPQAIVNRILR